MPTSSSRLPFALVLALLAATAPSLLAYNLSPSPTFLNQALAFGLWGWFVVALAQSGDGGSLRSALSSAASVAAVLLLVTAAALWTGFRGALPTSLALSGAGTLLAALVLLAGGASARQGHAATEAFAVFCTGWVVAGVFNVAIAAIQVFAPQWADGEWIAVSGIAGRAVGNLRQPNHLSSLLLWSAISVVALLELRRLNRVLGSLLFALMVGAVMLTASRTGTVSVALLALWGLADRRLSGGSRGLLIAAPVIYAAGWASMAWWATTGGHTFGGTARLAETDVSGSRFGIWSNTLAMIRSEPWTGVGFGEFNYAWSLTPFPHRPIAFFDHTHNLPLQLAVELGLPLAALLLLLMLLGLWQMWRGCLLERGDLALTQRCALMMVLMIGLHSQLEYPLWYSYFLLPAAWAWGYGLGGRAPAAGRLSEAGGLVLAGILLVAGGALSVVDYARVVPIFESADDAAPLAQRIARGQRSVLFSHHADYAAATTETGGEARRQALVGATHYLLDTRLMMAWAQSLAERGKLDPARHLAERLREFHNPLSTEFLAACKATPAPAEPPFQCQPPSQPVPWRDFLGR